MTSSIKNWRKPRLIERLKLNRWAGEDVEKCVKLKLMAKRNILFFFNQFLWTYDPRKESWPNHHPFILYEYQEDFLLTLEEQYYAGEDLGLDKSRDMGASWLVLGWIVYHWLFDNSFNALVGSRKEDLVDNFEADSLLGKCDYLIEKLPWFMKPNKWNPNKHRRHLLIKNPDNKNTIQGESANRDFSRQSRHSVIMLDEFAFWPFASSVWTATADSSPVRFVVSTPCGKYNKFARLRFPADGEDGIRFISLHWSLHPGKDQLWYEDQKSRRTKREIAQELDLDYEASGSERVYSVLRSNAILRQHVHVPCPRIPFTSLTKPDGKEIVEWQWRMSAGLDYGTRNKSAFVVVARDYDGRHWVIWERAFTRADLLADGFEGSMIQAIANTILKECPYYDNIDLIRADPSMWAETQNENGKMTSLKQQLVDLGVTKLVRGVQSDIDCIELINSFWANEYDPKLIVTEEAPQLYKEMEELEWEDWSELQSESRNLKEKIKDKNNHCHDALKYYLLGSHEASEDPRESVAKSYDDRVKEWKKKRAKKLERARNARGKDPYLGSKW